MRTYLTGLQDHNERERIADVLRAQGHVVTTPADVVDTEASWHQNHINRMQAALDCEQLVTVNRVTLMNVSAQESESIQAEVSTARRAQHKVVYVEDLLAEHPSLTA